jgi:DNA-binding transcriptional ArsR family regulator
MMKSVFKALNDSSRREILEILRLGDATAGEISDRFNMSKPSISHHLSGDRSEREFALPRSSGRRIACRVR